MALLRSGAAMVTAFNLVPVVEAVLPDKPKTEVRRSHLMLTMRQYTSAAVKQAHVLESPNDVAFFSTAYTVCIMAVKTATGLLS